MVIDELCYKQKEIEILKSKLEILSKKENV